jgi:hypothetical protein
MYVSKKDKKGVYRWKRANKTLKRKRKRKTLTMKDLQRMADHYNITKSGSKKELAERILRIREHLMSTKDKKALNNYLISII